VDNLNEFNDLEDLPSFTLQTSVKVLNELVINPLFLATS
jgi:hypothetical protein